MINRIGRFCVCRNITNSFRSFSIARRKKLDVRQEKKLSFPPAFNSLLKEWPKLLQCEIDEQNHQVQSLLEASGRDWTCLEERRLGIGPLSIVDENISPLGGRVIRLKKPGIVVSQRAGSNPYKSFRSGAPVVLCKTANLQPVAECIFLNTEGKHFLLKVRSSKEIDSSLEYAIIPSQDSGAIHSLKQLLSGDFADNCVGRQLLQYAFRSQAMPSIHNDRMPNSVSDELNDSQRHAVAAAMNKKRPFVCIQGPPGTGKTRVIAEIIRLLVRNNQKVLVCAASHVAVDNALEKTVDVMREYEEGEGADDSGFVSNADTMDEAMMSHEKYGELMDMSTELSGYDAKDAYVLKLRKRFNVLRYQIVKDTYKKHRVIFCTLFSNVIQRLQHSNWYPDVVIIDEAAQCSEPLAWSAIVKAPRCILVGDHSQLPPVVISEKARKTKLHVSLMERLSKEFKQSNISHLLSTQYRMNEKIMCWSSDHFYASRLVAGEEAASRLPSDVSNLAEDHPLNEPLLMINTDGAQEQKEFRDVEHQLSFRNIGEARILADYVNRLLSFGVKAQSIGIIAPYFAQVEYLCSLLPCEDLAINSVDAFQGQERDFILFSMVRNNPRKQIGFLRDARRLNVAVTRARRQFVLCGSQRMMETTNMLKSLYGTIKAVGKVYSHRDLDALLADDVSGASKSKRKSIS